ncbi:superoxide dismutase family protein [Actinoplanes sp. NPDC051851]|uniref:superoxide dismutase family protein n=1 Tax=Actinoplanes sp. NPDC051851 TaxID=3154753 RepID=UPI003446CFA7
MGACLAAPGAATANPISFGPWKPGANAVTYDPAVVPVGSTADLSFMATMSTLGIRLTVTGMRPHRTYGAHLHVNRCGADPKDAGPHYQHEHDPAATKEKPSSDPRYANPENEVWLDFTTDAGGSATVVRVHDGMFHGTRPRSLVLHAEKTKTAAGTAGSAGTRVACLNLPFGYDAHGGR